jgi:nicotinamidase-related amidase
MENTLKLYENSGFMHSIGLGKKPALLIVDLQKAITDIRSPLGFDVDSVVEHVASLLKIAREKRIPVNFITIEYEEDLKDAGYWLKKIPSLYVFKKSSERVLIDDRVSPLQGESAIVKKYPSAFFGTNLGALLTSQMIDTVIITGCATSGCIRATVLDAIQHGFKPIIPEECVGDRSKKAHEFALFEINAKYGDVISFSEVKAYLKNYKEEK